MQGKQLMEMWVKSTQNKNSKMPHTQNTELKEMFHTFLSFCKEERFVFYGWFLFPHFQSCTLFLCFSLVPLLFLRLQLDFHHFISQCPLFVCILFDVAFFVVLFFRPFHSCTHTRCSTTGLLLFSLVVANNTENLLYLLFALILFLYEYF